LKKNPALSGIPFADPASYNIDISQGRLLRIRLKMREFGDIPGRVAIARQQGGAQENTR
jgi:uncharacterized protein YjfI (DUF2170 family)